MGSTRFWLILVGAQILILAVLAVAGPNSADNPVLKYTGWVCAAGIFICIPPLVLKLWVAGQLRIGNGHLSMVQAVQKNFVPITLGVWALIGTALAMAMPRIKADILAEQVAAVADSDATTNAAANTSKSVPTSPVLSVAVDSSPEDTTLVQTPAAGSKTRTDILDILRFRLKTKGRFKVDHIRTYNQWAFVRATEVVELDKGELQETDLTVSALLQLDASSTIGGWRIVEMWTLPDDQQHPFANFLRNVRAKQLAEKLPAALFPGDL